MTSEPVNAPFEQGPHLICAVLCERVLQERDGVKTAVRMVDRVTRTVARSDAPEDMEPFNYELTLLVRLKAGSARGRFSLEFLIEKPNGESIRTPSANLHFEGPDDSGVDVVAPLSMTLGLQGLHWINVLVDRTRVTRVPFRVVYNPIRPLQRPVEGRPELPGPPQGPPA